MSFHADSLLGDVVVSLSADDTNPDTVLFPERRIVLTASNNTIAIGRSSKVQAKGLISAMDNAYFDSPVMSRDHARLSVDIDDKAVAITDLGSMHGTYVNGGNRIPPNTPQKLQAGDKVQFGMAIFRGSESFPPMSVKVGIRVNEPQASNTRRPSYKVYSEDEASSGEESSCEDHIGKIPAERAPVTSFIDLTTGPNSPRPDVEASVSRGNNSASAACVDGQNVDSNGLSLNSVRSEDQPITSSQAPAGEGDPYPEVERGSGDDSESIRLSSCSDALVQDEYDPEGSVRSESDDIADESESEDLIDEQDDYTSDDEHWTQGNQYALLWDDEEASEPAEQATETISADAFISGVGPTSSNSTAVEAATNDVPPVSPNPRRNRQPSPSDAALPRSIGFPDANEDLSMVDILGAKTGKYEYFSAREANRIKLSGKAPETSPVTAPQIGFHETTSEEITTSSVDQRTETAPLSLQLPPIRSEPDMPVVGAAELSLPASGEKFLNTPPDETYSGYPGDWLGDGSQAEVTRNPSPDAMSSAYVFQQHKMAAASPFVQAFEQNNAHKRTYVGIPDIVEIVPQNSLGENRSKKRKSDEISCATRADRGWETQASSKDPSTSAALAEEVEGPSTSGVAPVNGDDKLARPAKRLRHIAERLGYAALGGATVGAMVLGSLIYTAPTFS